MEKIDKEKILSEIRNEISNKGYKIQQFPNNDFFSERLMDKYLRWLDESMVMECSETHIFSDSLKDKVKKVLLKITAPVIYPIANRIITPKLSKQEYINISLCEVVNELYKCLIESNKEIESLKCRISKIENKSV